MNKPEEKKRLECPKCHSEAQCFHQDVGGVDYDDEYVLYCKTCGNIERVRRYGGSPVSDNWVTNCPYCGGDCFRHEGTPSELWGYSHRYLPLYSFKAGEGKAGESRFRIALRDEKVVLERYPYLESGGIELGLPVPYSNDYSSPVCDKWDNLRLQFESVEVEPNQTVIGVRVLEQKGYWYCGSFDDRIPSPTVRGKNRLIVKIDDSGEPSVEIKKET